MHNKLVVLSGDKPVYVSEAGWPDAGNIIGKAIPSSENATANFINFVSWARANEIKYFYFEAFDESWKAKYEGLQGAHWGIFDKSGQLKTGMMPVFEGDTVSGIWNINLSPGGDGTPTIEFTSVPALGSFNNLEGRIWHVNPFYYKIAVYICVSGSWWTKPYFDSPLTSISYDGTWVCDITTGGIDESTTNIIAYLVPWNSNPPLILGGSTLPEELETISLAKLEVQREATNSLLVRTERQIQIVSGHNQIQLFNAKTSLFQVYDMSGILVCRKKLSDDKKQIVSTEKWPVGIYILKLQDTEGVQVIKFSR